MISGGSFQRLTLIDIRITEGGISLLPLMYVDVKSKDRRILERLQKFAHMSEVGWVGDQSRRRAKVGRKQHHKSALFFCVTFHAEYNFLVPTPPLSLSLTP